MREAEGQHLRSVFTPEETQMHDWNIGWPALHIAAVPKNPKYRPDLCLNLHSLNMQHLARKIGYLMGEEGMLIPIEEFCSLTTSWLRKNAPPSNGIAPLVRNDGRSVTTDDILIENGQLAVVVKKAALIAQEGAARGATIISIR